VTADIRHDREARRFLVTAGRAQGWLDYGPPRDGVVELHHTFVPPEFRGQGVASRLVQAALDWARAEGLRVVPSCWYVASWLQRHPEYADLVEGRRA
jgi:hypothetical protein